MGLFSNVLSVFTGSEGAAAQKGAARVRVAASQEAQGEIREGADTARGRLEPFAQEGVQAVTNLADLVTNPEAQKKFVTENPFFEALAGQAKQDIFGNQAAKGKIGSGETAEALQNSLLLLGSDLLGQNINQRLNVGQQGLSAATNQANIDTGESTNLSNLITGAGEAQAGGILGAASERAAGATNLVNTGLQVAGIGL